MTWFSDFGWRCVQDLSKPLALGASSAFLGDVLGS